MEWPDFDPPHVRQLIATGQHEAASDMFARVLEHFETAAHSTIDARLQHFIDRFAATLLWAFTQPDYTIPDNHVLRFLRLNAVISNLVSLTPFRNTDPALEILRAQRGDIAKVLALLSPRNAFDLPHAAIFATDAFAASMWYGHYFESYDIGAAEPQTLARLRHHIEHLDDRWCAVGCPTPLYYGVTYVAAGQEARIKPRLHAIVRNLYCPAPRGPGAESRRLAVVTGNWQPGHSVHRCFSPLVATLRDSYELVLVSLGARPANEGSFSRCLRVSVRDGRLDAGPLGDERFLVAFFPDVGMNAESLFLANMRLARVQIASYGHPASTFGADIDYWLAGRDVELPPVAPNYAERVVLLPGSGIAATLPPYRPAGITPTDKPIVINCPWSAQKVNSPLLETLRRIADRVDRPLLFRFFPGGSVRGRLRFAVFERAVVAGLGRDRADVRPCLPYREYMAELERGSFTIDSYPFGGCDVIIDSLHVGRPVVTLEGTRWYNRIGSHLLRRVGLGDLATTTEAAYEATVERMACDDSYRAHATQVLQAADLGRALFAGETERWFRKSIDYLATHHDALAATGATDPIDITSV